MKIKAKVLPDDFFDALLAVIIGSFQTLVLFVIPGILAYLMTSSSVMGYSVSVIFYICFLLLTVWSIELNEEGIQFRSCFGTPNFLGWHEILDVQPASRKELLIQGWLWPVFPMREITTCLSSKGHYRIESTKGIHYYPPKDTNEFEEAIRARLKKGS